MAAESTVRILFLGDSAQAVRSVSRIESSFGGLGRATKLLTGALAIGLVGGLAASVKAAIEFQHQMELVRTQAGASQQEVDKMSKSLLTLAKSVGTGPLDLAKGLFHIESAGLRSADALHILRAAAEGAKVGNADLESTTNALIGAFKSGVKGAGSMQHAMGVLNAIVGAGNMRMNDLTSAMGTGLLSAARGVGISMQDVGAAVAELSIQNMNASEASTRLQMAFLTMAAGTSKGDAALKSIGITQSKLAYDMREHGLIFALQDLQNHLQSSGKDAVAQTAVIADVFGRRSLKAILPLIQHLDDLRARQAQINQTTGDFGKAWVATQQTVSFKLAQAKASIQAAAIPIGQLLLPAVIRVADAMARFADGVGQRMPQIKADFQTLSGVVSVLGDAMGKLASFAISPVGTASLIGVLTGVGAFKAIGAVSGLAIKAGEASVAMTGLGVAGMGLSAAAVPIAAGIGVLAAGLFLTATGGSAASYALNAVTDALHGLAGASEEAGQAGRDLTGANIQVKATAIAVKDAEKAYAAAVHASGRSSETAQKALIALRLARNQHAQAIANQTSAQQASSAAQKKENDLIDAQKAKLDKLRQTMLQIPTSRFASRDSTQNVSDFANSMNKVADQAAAAARAIPASDKAARNAAISIRNTATAAHNLALELGHIPTRKEIQVYLNSGQAQKDLASFKGALDAIHNVTVSITSFFSSKGTPPPHRAAGGFIPGPSPGAPVPILAHAGEIVLNRGQQDALGGPRVLASMFGFTGDEGPGFAAGGIVGKPKRRHAGTSPHHPRRPRWKARSKAAKSILAALDEIDENESNADRAYGQLTRQFDITQEQFIRTDANGVDYISHPDINQRVSEIDQLITARDNYLALLDEEKKELEKAVQRLKAAIADLLRAIKQEREQAAADAQHVRLLGKQLGQEQAKKKPNQKIITGLQNQITARGNSRSKHLSNAGQMAATVTEFKASLAGVQENLADTLPMDRRDVTLDIATLQSERKDVVGTTLPTSSGTGGSTGGVAGPDVSALLAQIARLNLALGIQTAQQAVIGSFAKGTLSVPETGLALVHAGESITPAGQTRGGAATVAPSQPHIEIHFENGLEWLEGHTKVIVDGQLMEQGRKANIRARSGRF